MTEGNQKKLTIILSIVIVILCAVLSFKFVELNNEKETYKAESEKYQQKLDNYEKKISNYQNEIEKYQKQIAASKKVETPAATNQQ